MAKCKALTGLAVKGLKGHRSRPHDELHVVCLYQARSQDFSFGGLISGAGTSEA